MARSVSYYHLKRTSFCIMRSEHLCKERFDSPESFIDALEEYIRY